jgi:hypothetical protein
LLEQSKGKAKEGQAMTEGYEVLILSDLVFNHSQVSHNMSFSPPLVFVVDFRLSTPP